MFSYYRLFFSSSGKVASTDSLESCDGPEVASLLSDSFLLVSFSPNGNTNLVGKNDVVKKKKILSQYSQREEEMPRQLPSVLLSGSSVQHCCGVCHLARGAWQVFG